MVEGPQATFLANGIRKKYKNSRLNQVIIQKGRYKKHGPPKNWNAFRNALPLRLIDVIKKGKVIFLFFEKDWVCIIKLGMTAWLDDQPEDANVLFDFGNKKLYYKDVRQFGTLAFTNDPILILKELNQIAPDVLDEKIPVPKPLGKSMDVLLMSQKLVLSGVGNIMKSEILYDAKIDPRRQGSQLSDQEWNRVFSSAKKIANHILRNIEQGKEDFSGVIQVYEKEKDSYGNQIENYVSKDGRRTYWVKEIQT